MIVAFEAAVDSQHGLEWNRACPLLRLDKNGANCCIHGVIIMLPMLRPASFLVVVALFIESSPAVAQTPPPGAPFDAAKHPNPIVTFVELKDFKPVDSQQATKESGVELMGISKEDGQRTSIDMADGRFVKNMSILGIRTDVTLYPVVRQRFKLSAGTDLVLYSFRFPRVALPKDFARIVLNEAAVEKRKKPSEMRFGGEKPEVLEIRGAPGLLFENERDGEITIYWQENGIGNAATAKLPRREFFKIIEDLL